MEHLYKIIVSLIKDTLPPQHVWPIFSLTSIIVLIFSFFIDYLSTYRGYIFLACVATLAITVYLKLSDYFDKRGKIREISRQEIESTNEIIQEFEELSPDEKKILFHYFRMGTSRLLFPESLLAVHLLEAKGFLYFEGRLTIEGDREMIINPEKVQLLKGHPEIIKAKTRQDLGSNS